MLFKNFLQSLQRNSQETDNTDSADSKTFFFAFWLTFVFLIVCGYGVFHHEMWRDEIQAWLLARDSKSIINLFKNMKYEGHPALWHLCLMPLSRISASPVMMQILHLLIAATTVFLFTRYAPFHLLHKFLFAFGYFALYEYAIVARNYAIGVLLITIFCVLYRDRNRRFVWIGIILILLAHTSVHALIVTIAIGIALLCEYLYFHGYKKEPVADNRRDVWIGFALIGFGIVTAVVQLNPPSDSGFATAWNFKFEFQRVFNIIKIITNAYLPLTKASMGFWNSHQLYSFAFFQYIRLPLCYLLVFWCVLRFLRKPTALLIYLIATVGLLSFFYIKYGGSMRHHGFLFFTFILTSWICHDSPGIKFPYSKISDIAQRFFGPVFTILLIFHFLGGTIALTSDVQYVFSQGKRTAEYIKAQGLKDMMMVGDTDFAVSTVVGYLEKKEVFYSKGSRFGSFVRWDKARTHGVSNEEIVKEASALSTKYMQDVLIIMNRALEIEIVEEHQLTLLSEFTGSTIGGEGFHLYMLRIP